MKQSRKDIIYEIIRFLIVGGFATLIDYTVFYLSNLVIFKSINEQVNLVISTALGFLFGLLTNWFLQRFVYNYLLKKDVSSKKVFTKFLLLSLFGLLITEIGMNVFSFLFDNLYLTIFNITFSFWKLFFKVLMTLIVLVINYLGRKFIVFKIERK